MATIFGLFGPGTSETILGTPEDDTIHPLGGWDTVDGGGGRDTVVVQALSTAFQLIFFGSIVYLDTVSAASASAERVKLTQVEVLQFSDRVVSLEVNDRFQATPGTDFIDGGLGTDTVAFARPAADHRIALEGGTWTVRDLVGNGGRDILSSIERLEFSDGRVALDLARSDPAGQAALLTGAVLGKASLRDKQALLGNVIGFLDNGLTLQELAAAVLNMTNFGEVWTLLAGGTSPQQIGAHLLRTVNGMAPDAPLDPAQLAAAVNALSTQPPGSYLATLALSDANALQVDLAGLAQTGLPFG
jgi:Ca2+-binding RTX toxin-like protein